MRHLIAIIAAAGLLAGCSKTETTGNASAANPTAGNTATGNTQVSSFDAGFRSTYRPKFVESCVAGAKQAATRAGNTAAIDFTTVCGCAADKLLATKSVQELMRGPTQADQIAVTQACLKENPIAAS